MDCPRCGLINPDYAHRCDCGYDFLAKTVLRSYDPSARAFPKSVMMFLCLVVVLNIINVFWLVTSLDRPLETILKLLWTIAVIVLTACFAARKNWARLGLAVLTFPLGTALLLTREARAYCFPAATN